MATVRKRNGKFQVQIRIKGASALTRTFESRKEATAWIREIEGKIEAGELKRAAPSRPKATLGAMLNEYHTKVLAGKRWNERELTIIRTVSKHQIYRSDIYDVTEQKIAEYRDQRLRSVKPATVVREIALLSCCFDICRREWGFHGLGNPTKLIKKPRINNLRERRITQEEMAEIIRQCRSEVDQIILDMIRLSIETAVRRGELLRIKWGDVNVLKATLRIPFTKNGRSRTIPLTPKAVEILRRQNRSEYDDKVFHFGHERLRSRWESLKRRACINDLRWHDLRHEGISRHAEMGLSVPEIAMISGHRDYKVLGRYLHLKPENVAEKLARLSAESK